MAAPARARKLAERIQVIVAQMLETRVKDPRLGFVTITDARVTNDLQSATIFYTVYGDDADRAATAAALESAKGVLRSEVGRQTGVRHTPTLAFVADGVPDTARHIQELLETAAQRDAEVHRVAAAASYAGAPDPYRAPVTDTVDAREPGDARAPGDASDRGDAVEGDSDGFRSALGGGRPD